MGLVNGEAKLTLAVVGLTIGEAKLSLTLGNIGWGLDGGDQSRVVGWVVVSRVVWGLVVAWVVSMSISPVGPGFNPQSVSSVSVVSRVGYINFVMSVDSLSV